MKKLIIVLLVLMMIPVGYSTLETENVTTTHKWTNMTKTTLKNSSLLPIIPYVVHEPEYCINKTARVDMTQYGLFGEFKEYPYCEWSIINGSSYFTRTADYVYYNIGEDGIWGDITISLGEEEINPNFKGNCIWKNVSVDLTMFGRPGEFKVYEYGECINNHEIKETKK